MEHNPLLSFEDGLEVTYSDLKKRDNGNVFITIYFEKPNSKGFFDTASIDFPGSDFKNIKGFTEEDLKKFREYVDRSGHTALEFSKEEAYA
ncbi:MAG: hypothetical protein IJ695_11105 [Butyrivibrio sp.]|nr:hypothetical protein [Butyrivibrio sp.]